MLTAKKALRITRELWTWLAENPDKEKEDWPDWVKYGRMAADCPLCEYKIARSLTCLDCLVDWGGRYKVCLVRPALYRKWIFAKKPKTRSKYAWGIVKLVKEAEERQSKKGDK